MLDMIYDANLMAGRLASRLLVKILSICDIFPGGRRLYCFCEDFNGDGSRLLRLLNISSWVYL